ncbi:MAG: aminodeoxychorismate lyase [Cocleimonas sp.]|nr:aminodeoxychorismate lyase [Cocleimonas sp.]
MTTWVNGNAQSTLTVSDRGLQYGDGVWETLRIADYRAILLDEHLVRLRWGCRVLALSGLSEALLRQEISCIIKNTTHGILKIIITRGSGGRGYSSQGIKTPTRILSLHPLPPDIEMYRKTGIQIQYCKTQLSHNPRLAGFKHLNRLEQVLARSELSPNCQEGIVCDIKGNVIEGTMSNLFLFRQQQVITPALELCGIKGIMRDYLIRLLQHKKINVIERNVTQEELDTADALIFSNSIIGVWPVIRNTGKNGASDLIHYLQKQIYRLEHPV